MALPDHPMNSTEEYLAMIAGQEGAQLPDHPRSRMEQYLDYIAKNGGGKVTEGYLYQGSFYKETAHTTLITPVKDCLYIDLTSGTWTLYMYNGTAYVAVGGGVTTNKFLSGWDCSTGLPVSFPHSVPYTYETGMHFRVSAVASGSGSNYKPDGATYSGAASTVAETGKVLVGDFYFYDGTTWLLLINTEHIHDVQDDAGNSYVNAQGIAVIPRNSLTVKTVLDSPLQANTVYDLGSKSSLPLALPASSAKILDVIFVQFTASAVFTPTITGSYTGETAYATTNGKKYTYAFEWDGAKWKLATEEYGA